MWPLSTYTGMILLQTTPPHLINQIDRLVFSEKVLKLSEILFQMPVRSITYRWSARIEKRTVLAIGFQSIGEDRKIVKFLTEKRQNFDQKTVEIAEFRKNTVEVL